MHRIPLKNAINNLTLKIIALIIGYGIWFLLSRSQQSVLSLEAPVCFYNHESCTIQCPESLTITLAGRRSDIYALDHTALALHINAGDFGEGKHLLQITPSMLFLPSSIKLLHYSPLNAIITIQKKTKPADSLHETTTT